MIAKLNLGWFNFRIIHIHFIYYEKVLTKELWKSIDKGQTNQTGKYGGQGVNTVYSNLLVDSGATTHNIKSKFNIYRNYILYMEIFILYMEILIQISRHRTRWWFTSGSGGRFCIVLCWFAKVLKVHIRVGKKILYRFRLVCLTFLEILSVQ
jgi:hypothetical protein